MSIATGTSNVKTQRRLASILQGYTNILAAADPRERCVITAIHSLGVYATTVEIARLAGLSRTKTQSTILKFADYHSLTKQPVVTDQTKPKESNDLPYKVITDLSGNSFVPLPDVEALVERHNESKNVDTPIQVRINNASHTKNMARNFVTVSVYIDNKDGITLEDLFELLAVGNTVGITI